MNDLTKANVGDMLNQADLSQFILSMGKGVAEAQVALDANSIAQLPKFAQPLAELGGKSLIQAGMMPSFYHFTKATLTASLALSLRVAESLGIGGKATLDTNNSTTANTVTHSESFKKLAATVEVSSTKSFTSAAFANATSALEKIHSYSGEQSIGTEKHYVIADRAAVSVDASASATGLIAFNKTDAIIAVPPAGNEWKVWSFTNQGSALTALSTSTAAEDVYILGAVPSTWDATQKAKWIGAVFFDFNKAVVTPDNVKRLRAIAHIAKALGAIITLTGHTDKKGEPTYNLKLGEQRANQVMAALRSFQSGLSFAPVISKGETEALVAETDPDDAARQPDRRVDIVLSGGAFSGAAFYIFVSGTGLAATIAGGTLASTDGSGTYPADGAITGITSGSTLSTVTAVASAITTKGDFEASTVGELVYLTNTAASTKDIFKLSIFKEDGSLATFTKTNNSSSTTNTSSTSSSISDMVQNKLSTVAFTATVDARFARSFDMEMKGNMSITAELVSVPPPAALADIIAEMGE